MLNTCPIQAEIDKHGVIISSNGPHKITATEVQEHLIMPDYPDTSNEGIVHFIHSKNPMENLSEDTSISETSLYQAFTTEMSRVGIPCTDSTVHILCYANRYNSENQTDSVWNSSFGES